MDSRTRIFRLPLIADLAWGAALTGLLILIAGVALQPDRVFYGLALLLSLVIALPLAWYWPEGRDFGWANRVTLVRAALVVLLVSLAPFAGRLTGAYQLWIFGTVSVMALLLDGVDGTVARATRSETDFGARFDMELDALFVLGLCLAVIALDKAGIWVLALGLMRYGFVAAGRCLPFINRPLPESFRRKTVFVWQVVTLIVAVLPVASPGFASLTLALALALLCYSFYTDLRWLWQHRRSF